MPSVPPASISLSQNQRLLLKPALLQMAVAVQRYREGKSPSPFIPITFERQPANRRYDARMAQEVENLWTMMCPSFSAPGRLRFRLGLVELMVCQLAATASKKFYRKGLASPVTSRPLMVRTRLLGRLERARRRARRAMEKTSGATTYQQLMTTWKPFAVWLRYYALTYSSYRPTPNDPLHRWYRLALATAEEIAKQELTIRKFPLPNDVELRRFIRQALAAVRRGRTGFGVRTLITTPLGATYLGDFIARRAQPALLKED